MTGTNDYLRLAEDDGACIRQNPETGFWSAHDADGMAIVHDAMSCAEAARLYCDDKGLSELLTRMVAEAERNRSSARCVGE